MIDAEVEIEMCKGSESKICYLKSKLFKEIKPSTKHNRNKISVIGAGEVGLATAISLLAQRITTDLAMVDIEKKKLTGEMLDLQHGSYFFGGAQITAGTDYAITENSKICIITAGVRPYGSETRMDVLKKNVNIIKNIVTQIVKYSPECIIIVISNPADVLAYIAWKSSGFPVYRVIGSGTNLDSSRFRFLLAQILDVAVESVHGWVIGEHGASMVTVWSGVNIAGTKLIDLDPDFGTDKEDPFYKKIEKQVNESGYLVRSLKGSTNWAIALSVCNISESILHNSKKVIAVSTLVKGMHGIEEDVYLSLPCVVGGDGITNIMNISLTEKETDLLQKSAKIIDAAIKEVM